VSTNLLESPVPTGFAIGARGLRQWTSPTRLKAWTALVAVLTAILALTAVMTVGGLRGGVGEIGGTAGPEVENTAALAGTLSDLDAQVANLLLAGKDPALAATAEAADSQFTADQTGINATLQSAIAAAGSAARTRQSVQALLNGLAQYEGEVADVRLLESQSPGVAGRPDAAVLAEYDLATDQMRNTLIPAADALITSNDNELNSTYVSQRSSAQRTLWLLAGVGVLLVLALVLFQLYLTRAYHRLLNPFLAAAAVVALLLTVLSVSLMHNEVNKLTVAKVDAFNSVIALTQAQAVSSEANADESRYLVDPGRAAQYLQDFENESQELLNLGPGVTYSSYQSALTVAVAKIPNPPPAFDSANVAFGGYLGTELNNVTFPGEGPAALAATQAYQAYEQSDRVLRETAQSGNLTGAIAFDTGSGPAQSDGIYTDYLTKLRKVTTINEDAFASSAGSALDSLGAWTILPIVGALLILALTVLGVRPRLAEYQ
jgi:hypothetical protein